MDWRQVGPDTCFYFICAADEAFTLSCYPEIPLASAVSETYVVSSSLISVLPGILQQIRHMLLKSVSVADNPASLTDSLLKVRRMALKPWVLYQNGRRQIVFPKATM